MAESSIFWDQLIQLIEDERLVPIVGQDLLTTTDGGASTLIYARLAKNLAGYLGLPADDLPDGGELNEVACRFMAQGNQLEDLYPAIKTVALKTVPTSPPVPLLQLAAIRPLKLFVTTTFDDSMERALDQVRFGGSPRTRVLAYSPTEVEDLPRDMKDVDHPIVYHLLGRLSAMPVYAVTQEDLVEFVHALQSETRRPQGLFDELARQSLLVLGNSFNGWLARFFMRLAKRQRLSVGGKTDYVADGRVSADENLVLFFRHFSRGTKVVRSANAVEFVAELHQRWVERHGTAAPEADAAADRAAAGSGSGVAGEVFLSYASEDRSAVEKIKVALEAAGVDVFFDKDDLHAGDAWESKLRRRVRECSLFIPIISRRALTPHRRFFRVEWNLALEEAQMASFSDEEAFVLPVVIDDTTAAEPAVPARFKTTQWQVLPDGVPTPEFVARVQQLYRKHQKALAAGS
jgi:hypothetical protein